jgi:DNA modification methylase
MRDSAAGVRLAESVRRVIKADLTDSVLKQAIPKLAKDKRVMETIEQSLLGVPTRHEIICGDARRLTGVKSDSIHLVVTSPPYWNLKKYSDAQGQLGDMHDYQDFVSELGRVWSECFRVLIPGGRLIINVGDVCLSRKAAGRHSVMPLHASIIESCRSLGFDNLAPIIWHKIANAKTEADGAGTFLGKPYEPNAIVKNDIEFVLMQRKPGGYRSPSFEARLLSVISEENHRSWFQQIWTMPGASTKQHPAPYPVEFAERLIRMFSFVGDTVLDPFLGSGSTSLAAARWGRHSVGVEIVPEYVDHAIYRLKRDLGQLASNAEVVRAH